MRSRALALGVGSCFWILSCQKHESAGPAAANSAEPVAAASVSATPKAEKPWFVGSFSGTYQAEVAAPKSEVGAPRQWQKDDGKSAVGPGTLLLSIGDDGAIDGSAQGAFGDEAVSGKLEGDVVRASLLAKSDSSFHGTLIAARAGDGFKGSIQASSADSNTVRAASLELTRKP